MNKSFNNVSIFIKRAEEYQTKEFIINAFKENKIGKVSDVKFIKKQNDMGKQYNGAIVIFERWDTNRLVESLFNEMSSSNDGTTKFYYNSYRYWIIKVHSQKLPECEESVLVDSSLPDKERISQLEELVKSMSAKIHYMETRHEKCERIMMDYERKDTQHHLYNIELMSQIEEKNTELIWTEKDFRYEIEKIQEENNMLRFRLELSEMDINRKENECENLREEIREQTSITCYIENQVSELKDMLHRVSDNDPIKKEFNKYVKEYLN
jgi:chromosome segregation ATPase